MVVQTVRRWVAEWADQWDAMLAAEKGAKMDTRLVSMSVNGRVVM